MKLEILIRPVAEYRTRNDIAIHALEPSYLEILDHIETGMRDLFPLIVIYTKRGSRQRLNILNGNSTWSKLIRDLPEADVRAGEVGFKHGTSIGEGFTIYFQE